MVLCCNKKKYDPTVTRVSTSEIVHDIADMFPVVDIPMGIEKFTFVEKNSLQEQLAKYFVHIQIKK